MGTRPYDFNTGFDTVTAPSVTDPSASTDIVSLGYASKTYAKGVETIAALKAIGSTSRTDLQPVYVEELDAWFHFDSGSSATGDDFNVITPTAGTGRWLRVAAKGEGAGQDVATATNIDALDNTTPVVRLTGSTTTNLRGILAGGSNQRLVLLNASSADVTIVHESGSVATAARRISVNNSADVTLKPNGGALLAYDKTTERWRLVSFTATGGTSWSDIDGKTAETAPDKADLLYLGDASASTLDKITLENLWKVINTFTTETSIDQDSDFLAVYDATATAIRKASVNSLLGGVRPAFVVTRSGNQSIASSSVTKVQYDSESIDTNGNFDSTTNYRFTPTVAGYYLIGHYGRFDSGVDTTQIGVLIYYNGSQAAGAYSHMSTNKNCGGFVARVMFFNGSTDYVEAYAFQDSGSARNWEASAALSGFFGIRIA